MTDEMAVQIGLELMKLVFFPFLLAYPMAIGLKIIKHTAG